MLYRKKFVLAKIEASYGVDSTPDGSNAILTKNCQINLQQGNRVTRDLDRPTLGNDEEIATSRYTTISFEVELAGSGVAGDAPGVGPLLRACALSETISPGVEVIYQPVSESFESVTLYYLLDGELHKVTGAQGTASMSMGADGMPMLSFEFTGLHNDAVAASSITPDVSAFVRPLAMTKVNTPTFTVHGYAATAESFSLDLANEVIYRNVVNSESVKITDRAPSGSLKIEAPDLAIKDFHAITKSGALGAIQVVHGTVAGNVVQIDAPNVQLSRPAYSDSGGIAVLDMSTKFIPSSAGDDELTLTFK